MSVRCGARWATAALLTILTLATGCVRRTTISQDFGLSGRVASQRTTQKAGAGSLGISRRAATSPDEFLRAIFQQQTQGAFNPLTDDRRVQALQTRLRLNPQDVAARLELAVVYENYRFYDDGLEQYTETLRLARSAPGAADGNAPLAEQAVLGLGRCARASGRTREAVPLLEAFLKERPSASSWNELGLLYEELGDLTAGESAFREAVARDAESGWLHNNLGYNLLLQNKAEAAEGEFRRALELNPKSATARNNLGVVLARRGDLQGALEQFQLAADAATAHNNLAVVLLETGQYGQSREQLVKALNIRRYFAPALANFKLVQERIRERAELPKAGRLPPSAVRVPSALLELGKVAPPASGDRSPNDQKGQQEGAESKNPEDRR
ncbi:MAG: tetratricopeptide repeat protein [Acidobacteria bacterium]|nr:tetratricopeptide repeat protein [Acidobacteriota bacterium]